MILGRNATFLHGVPTVWLGAPLQPDPSRRNCPVQARFKPTPQHTVARIGALRHSAPPLYSARPQYYPIFMEGSMAVSDQLRVSELNLIWGLGQAWPREQRRTMYRTRPHAAACVYR